MIGGRAGPGSDGRSTTMERRCPPQKYARLRTSCTGSATGPSAPRARGAAEPTRLRAWSTTPPNQSCSHLSRPLARSRIGRCPPGEAAATARQHVQPLRGPQHGRARRLSPGSCLPDPSPFSNQSPPPVVVPPERPVLLLSSPPLPSPGRRHNIYSRDAHTAP
ncbi:hypothetical protein PAHAL_5G403700 [Panicum hallii]|uniref:Uncharacterized protein n=1 Tax=Panicum hallii TaxID=206008 RepID=A0A2T8IMW0_9POAL|nr:hypothetical protein PAHAL_5G403700 [Panicum hallii]